MEKRSSETRKIPGYKLLWHDLYRISPVLAWVGLFSVVGAVAAIIFGGCMAVVAAYEASGCLVAVAVAAFIGVVTLVGLFGMFYQLVVPIPWYEEDYESED